MNIIGVDAKLSSAYHPETDGQTERVNQILEQYLRCSVNFLQNNWRDLLLLAEICYNNLKHASTGISPFYANFGFHPKFQIISKQTDCPASTKYSEELLSAHKIMQQNLNEAQYNYKHYADRHRCKAPEFEVGNKVWLLRKNLRTVRPSAKLDFKKIGPFAIKEKINANTYRLALPATWKIHDVFHVSLLEKYFENPYPGRRKEDVPLPPVVVDGNPEYEVDYVVAARKRRNKQEYLIHWKGYGIHERTWDQPPI